MKLPGGNDPPGGDFYALHRSTVLEVLTRHYVTVGRDRQAEELYLLEQEYEEPYYISLPEMVPAEMVFRLARTFRIPPEEFYETQRDRMH